MVRTPCREPLCPELVERSQEGYCEKHKHRRRSVGWGRRRKAPGATTKRGYGARWRKIRERALRRDNYLCQKCLAYGFYVPATEVDHVVNKAAGGTDELSNLQSLCTPCHKAKTLEESRKGQA